MLSHAGKESSREATKGNGTWRFEISPGAAGGLEGLKGRATFRLIAR